METPQGHPFTRCLFDWVKHSKWAFALAGFLAGILTALFSGISDAEKVGWFTMGIAVAAASTWWQGERSDIRAREDRESAERLHKEALTQRIHENIRAERHRSS